MYLSTRKSRMFTHVVVRCPDFQVLLSQIRPGYLLKTLWGYGSVKGSTSCTSGGKTGQQEASQSPAADFAMGFSSCRCPCAV